MTLHKLKNEDELILKTAERLYTLFPKEEYLSIINETKQKLNRNDKEKSILFRKFIKNI